MAVAPSGAVNYEDTFQRKGLPSVVYTGGGFSGGGIERGGLVTLAATTTLVGGASILAGLYLLNNLASETVILPTAASVPPGVPIVFAAQVAPTSGAGYLVDIAAGDAMKGNGFTFANGKGALNTQATAKAGDTLTVASDGVLTWYIVAVTGTWARET